jgi:hypothetical protein
MTTPRSSIYCSLQGYDKADCQVLLHPTLSAFSNLEKEQGRHERTEKSQLRTRLLARHQGESRIWNIISDVSHINATPK